MSKEKNTNSIKFNDGISGLTTANKNQSGKSEEYGYSGVSSSNSNNSNNATNNSGKSDTKKG